MSDSLAMLKSHAWVPLAALAIHIAIRLLKDDRAVAWFPLSLPSKWRPWLALILGAASGVIDKVADGATWTSAIGSGLVAALIAMGMHDTIVESARNGREIGEPKAVKKPEALVNIVPPTPLLALCLTIAFAVLLGCAPCPTTPPPPQAEASAIILRVKDGVAAAHAAMPATKTAKQSAAESKLAAMDARLATLKPGTFWCDAKSLYDELAALEAEVAGAGVPIPPQLTEAIQLVKWAIDRSACECDQPASATVAP